MAALFLAPLAAGILCGYAAGGRLRNLLHTRIRAVWLLFVAAGLQYLHFRSGGGALLAAVFGVVAVWLVVNLYRRSFAVTLAVATILAGGAMNGVAIAANGRMPFSEAAVRAAQVPPDQQARGHRSPKHVAADRGTRLRWLGDVIPVTPIRKVVSIGDIVLLLGVAGLLAAAMRRQAVSAAAISATAPHEVQRPAAAKDPKLSSHSSSEISARSSS